ncbi:MAG: DUF4160 domain-containing protein [Eubacterium sp.]|nr:DUF4160 domain-containing protein [Eubacterium sp.]
MPQILKIGAYVVFFWSKENDSLEPVHVHVSEGVPTQNATKIWITKCGKALIANNNSRIFAHQLQKILRIVEANSDLIVTRWESYFGEISYYC